MNLYLLLLAYLPELESIELPSKTRILVRIFTQHSVDTSALVKRYVEELGSKDVLDWMDPADTIGTALVTRIELASAITRATRMNHLTTYFPLPPERGLNCSFSAVFHVLHKNFAGFYADPGSVRRKPDGIHGNFGKKSPPTSQKCRFAQTLFYKGRKISNNADFR